MHRAMELLKSFPRAKTLGIHVDGVVIDRSQRDDIPDDFLEDIADLVQKQRYPSGKQMFQLKDESGTSLPTWKRCYEERSYDLDLRGLKWRFIVEADAGDQDPQDFSVEPTWEAS